MKPTLSNRAGGKTNNINGLITNGGGTVFTNSGRINMFVSLLDNRGTIENTGTIEIFHFGACQNLAGSWETRPAALW